MSIGELPKATSVKIVTIRYYEQIGILPPPDELPKITVPTARSMPESSTLFAGAGI